MSIARFVILLVASQAVAAAPGAKPVEESDVDQQPRVLKSIRSIQAHNDGGEKQEYEVEISASVTFFDREWTVLYVQEETETIRVNVTKSRRTPNLVPGDRVEINGTFEPVDGRSLEGLAPRFDRSPVIHADRVSRLGQSELPDPIAIDSLSGTHESQFVELTCTPYFYVSQDARYRYFRAFCDGSSVMVCISREDAQGEPATFLQSPIRCRGVLGYRTYDSMLDLYVTSPNGVSPAPNELDTGPDPPPHVSIGQVRSGGEVTEGTEVVIRGVVWVTNRDFAIISDGTGYFVISNKPWKYVRGDVVEVTGVLTVDGDRYRLGDSTTHLLGRPEGERPAPIDVDGVSLAEGSGRFVRVTGFVDSSWIDDGEQWMRIDVGDTQVDVRVLAGEQAGPEQGDNVKVIGASLDALEPVNGVARMIGKVMDVREAVAAIPAAVIAPPAADLPTEPVAAWSRFYLPILLALVSVATVLLVLDLRARQRDREYRKFQHGIEQRLSELSHIARLNTLSEMVGALAHELNQPLSAITNFAAAAKISVDNDLEGDLPSMLDKIGEQSLRAGTVIRRLRALVKRETDGRTHADISRVVEQSVELYRTQIALENGLMEVDLQHDIPPVDVDEIQIQQVVLNLLANARDATSGLVDPAPRIAIGTELLSSTEVCVWVEDNGKGMANVSRAFDRYFTTKENGTGLGLAISKSIVQSHGGTIDAVGLEPRGTRVRFTIPIASGQLLATGPIKSAA